jgi:hypothetical protein
MVHGDQSNREMTDKLLQDVATLLERSKYIQDDLVEMKELIKLQNGRVKKLEDEMLKMQASKKVILSITAGIASLVTFLGNLFLRDWLNGR